LPISRSDNFSKENRSLPKSPNNSNTSINSGTNSKGFTGDKESASRSGHQKQGERGNAREEREKKRARCEHYVSMHITKDEK
jgi:hypothetical protein